MNIKERFRNLLLEREQEYDYGCVMLYLKIDENYWNDLTSIIDKKDVYNGTKEDPGYGIEDEPHITILYGIHHDEITTDELKTKINQIKNINLTINKVSSFDNNDDYSVIKFDIESDDLVKYNKMFKKLPHTSTFPNYHPHMTIAYVKPDNVKDYIKEINQYIKDNEVEYEIDSIVYSPPKGEKKYYKL